MNDTFETIQVTKLNDDEVMEITLNRPEVHNAFNPVMIRELTKVAKNCHVDEKLRLVIFKGSGPSFCAGADLNWMQSMAQYSFDENCADANVLFTLFDELNNIPQPTIMVCHKAAFGGGVGLCAVADFVICDSDCKFALSEVKLGLLPAVISPFVVRKTSASFARAYFTSGMILNAQEALQSGLVQKVVATSELSGALITLISDFLKAAPQAAREAKSLARSYQQSITEEIRGNITKLIANRRISSEGQEGMQAMLAKRRPWWQKS